MNFAVFRSLKPNCSIICSPVARHMSSAVVKGARRGHIPARHSPEASCSCEQLNTNPLNSLMKATRLVHISAASVTSERHNLRLVRERTPPRDDRQPVWECDGDDTACLSEDCQCARHKRYGETAISDPAYNNDVSTQRNQRRSASY